MKAFRVSCRLLGNYCARDVSNSVRVLLSPSLQRGRMKLCHMVRFVSVASLQMRQFWGQQQRFFKEMANCAKVSFVVEQAKKALSNGMSVVVGLQSTGESGMDKVGESTR